MVNPKIIERIAVLYADGKIDDRKLDWYVAMGILTKEDVARLKEGDVA